MLKAIRVKFLELLPARKCLAQNLLFLSSIALFFTYSLSIPWFSNRYPFNYVSIVICGLMCISMLLYAVFYGKIKINALIGFLFLFNLVILINAIINQNFSNYPKTIFLMSVVSFCIYQFASSYRRPNLLITLILVAGFAFSLIYIFHYRNDLFDFSKIFDSRLGSFFDNENEISKEFGFFCVISIGFLIKSKNIAIKIASGILVPLFLFLILSTGSISNLLTTTIVCFLAALICIKSKTGKVIVAVSITALVVAFISLLQMPFMGYFKTRIDNIVKTLLNFGKTSYDGSAYNRFGAAINTFLVGLNRPIFGFGYMSATKYNYDFMQAHNNFAELFIDFGILGLLIYESLILIPLLKKQNDDSKAFTIPILLYMLIFQLFLTTYYKKFEYIFFAYVYAALDAEFETQYVLFNSKRFKHNNKTVIFEIIPSLSPLGGAEKFVMDFVMTAKQKYGDNVDIKLILLYKKNLPPLSKKIVKNNIEIVELNKRRGIDIACALKLRDLILEYRPNIIHTHLLSITTLFIAMPFKNKQVRCYHTIHHNLSHSDLNHKLLKFLAKKDYLTPICVADGPAKTYEKYLGLKPCCIENGIVISNFNSEAPLSIRKNDFLIVGRFVPIKNQKFIIDLVSNDKKLQKYTFSFLGDGPLFDEYKNHVKQLGLSKTLILKGFINDVEKYMSDSRVLLIPSFNEGNPLVVNEALASGMYVLGNDVGGIHDLLSGNKRGELANIYNPHDFAKKMIDLLKIANKERTKFDRGELEKINIELTVNRYFELFGVGL